MLKIFIFLPKNPEHMQKKVTLTKIWRVMWVCLSSYYIWWTSFAARKVSSRYFLWCLISKGISIFLNASSFPSIYNYSDQRQQINGTIYINDQITSARKMSKYQAFYGPFRIWTLFTQWTFEYLFIYFFLE